MRHLPPMMTRGAYGSQVSPQKVVPSKPIDVGMIIQVRCDEASDLKNERQDFCRQVDDRKLGITQSESLRGCSRLCINMNCTQRFVGLGLGQRRERRRLIQVSSLLDNRRRPWETVRCASVELDLSAK